MSASSLTSQVTATPVSFVRGVFKPGNLLPAVVWAFFLYGQILSTRFPPPLSRVLLIIIVSSTLILFLVRLRVLNKADRYLGRAPMPGRVSADQTSEPAISTA